MSKKEVATAVAATEEKKLALKPHVQELSGKIQTLAKVNKTDGTISDPEEKSIFVECMPEGITVDSDTLHTNYRSDFVAATAHASGVLAVGVMAGSKKITTVTAEFAMNRDSVGHSVEHDRTFAFGSGADRRETTKYGNMTTDVNIRGTHGSAGQLKVARSIVAELASAQLSGKK